MLRRSSPQGTLYVVSDDGSLTAFRQDAPDNIGPQFLQLSPRPGATARGEGLTYGALLVDEGSGIDPASVSLQVDGKADTQALYRAGQNAIYNTPTTPLKDGEHQITVKAADWRGNTTAQTWTINVSDQGRGGGFRGGNFNPYTPNAAPGIPNYPGNGGRNPGAPPPPPPIAPF